MLRNVVWAVLATLPLISCGRLGSPGSSPVPGPTPTVTPAGGGTAIPVGPGLGGRDLPTDGPVVTG